MSPSALKIAIIGRGNVAGHLERAFSGNDLTAATKYNSHTLEGLPKDCELYIIAVSDGAIAEVSERLAEYIDAPTNNAVIAHTSGAVGIETLCTLLKHRGVFYPLQTFTAGVELQYSEIPILIEGSDNHSTESLRRAAGFSGKIVEADSARRAQIHLAAVFACNFSCRMLAIADDLMQSDPDGSNLLIPLVRETIRKATTTSPDEAQTGPARRGDLQALHKELDMLSDYPQDYSDVYRAVTNSILQRYNHDRL